MYSGVDGAKMSFCRSSILPRLELKTFLRILTFLYTTVVGCATTRNISTAKILAKMRWRWDPTETPLLEFRALPRSSRLSLRRRTPLLLSQYLFLRSGVFGNSIDFQRLWGLEHTLPHYELLLSRCLW